MAVIKDSKSEPLPPSQPPYAKEGFVPPPKVAPAQASDGLTQAQILAEAQKRAGTSNVNAGDPGGDTYDPKTPEVGVFKGQLENDLPDVVTGAAPFIPPAQAPAPVQPSALAPVPNPPVAVTPVPQKPYVQEPHEVRATKGHEVAAKPVQTPLGSPQPDIWANIAKFLGDAGQGVLASLPGIADDVMSRASRGFSAMGGTLEQNPYILRNKQAFEQAQQQRELQKQREMPSIEARAEIEKAIGVLPVETQELIRRALGTGIVDLGIRTAAAQPGGAGDLETNLAIKQAGGAQEAQKQREQSNMVKKYGLMQQLLGSPFMQGIAGGGANGVSGTGAIDQQFGNGNWRQGLNGILNRPGGGNDLNALAQQDQARSDRDLSNRNATINTASNLLGNL